MDAGSLVEPLPKVPLELVKTEPVPLVAWLRLVVEPLPCDGSCIE